MSPELFPPTPATLHLSTAQPCRVWEVRVRATQRSGLQVEALWLCEEWRAGGGGVSCGPEGGSPVPNSAWLYCRASCSDLALSGVSHPRVPPTGQPSLVLGLPLLLIQPLRFSAETPPQTPGSAQPQANTRPVTLVGHTIPPALLGRPTAPKKPDPKPKYQKRVFFFF